jgi:hypothetical protein
MKFDCNRVRSRLKLVAGRKPLRPRGFSIIKPTSKEIWRVNCKEFPACLHCRTGLLFF